MAVIEDLPCEVVLQIADECVRGVHPKLGQYPSSYAKYHSHLARTSRHFYAMLNLELYKRNVHEDPPLDSCVLWAATSGQLNTIRLAHGLGADLSNNGSSRDPDNKGPGVYGVPGRSGFSAAPLHLAIFNGHRDIVEYLLDNGAVVDVEARRFCVGNTREINSHCPSFPYPLHVALAHKSGVEDAAAMLIKHGAHLMASNMDAFPIVAQSGRIDLVRLLLELDDPAVTAAALRYAVEMRDADLFWRMMARPNLNVATPDHTGRTALHFAARLDDMTYAMAILQRPEVNADAADDRLRTALHTAAKRGNLPLVERILQHQEVNAAFPDEMEKTALHFAVAAKSVGVTKRLLERAEVNAGVWSTMIDTRTPIQLAIHLGVPELVDMLLARHDVSATMVEYNGRTLLHHLVDTKNKTGAMAPFVDKLIARGVPIDAVADVDTALLYAIKRSKFAMALTLLEHNASTDITPPDPFLWTPLHHCLFGHGPKQTELVAKLISLGTGMDSCAEPNENGSTAYNTISCGSQLFFAAVYARNIDCMKLLIDAGAAVHSNVMYTERDQSESGLNFGDQESLLAGIFRHRLRIVPASDDCVEEVREITCLLLQHGAALEPVDESRSALDWGYLAAIRHGSFALLNLLLDNSTKDNAPAFFIEDVAVRCRANMLNPDNQQVIRLLTRFMTREYPGMDLDGLPSESG